MNSESKIVLLVKYGEISLRKGNRAFFEQQIMDTMRSKLKRMGSIVIRREQGRFLVENTQGDLDIFPVIERIQYIFGVTAFCVCIKTSEQDIKDLQRIGMEFFKKNIKDATSFKVITKRSEKKYPLLSGEISALIGEHILDSLPNLRVDVHNPEVVLWVEIRNHIYFYVDSFSGVGGLPYSASGKGVLLLSGGIDSPVAGYLAARRGVEIHPIYFHSPPYVSERAADKVRDIARALSKYTGRLKLTFINFTEIQLFLQENVHVEKLTIMLKRAMLRVACMHAKNVEAQCLITGDSIGQVASQTLQSIAAQGVVSDYEIIRPLATMDKQQIIDISKEIKTFEISIRPYDDCCTLFVAKHPESKPNVSVLNKIEERFMPGLHALIEKAISDSWVEIFE